MEGPNSILVFVTYIVLDVFTEHDDGVIVLFHATLGALDTRLEPFHNTLGVEHVLALEFLVGPLGVLKTHCTRAGKMGTAHPVLDGLLLALRPVPSQG